MSASAAAPTAWTSTGLVFLAVVCIAPVPAVAGFHSNYGFVNKHNRNTIALSEVHSTGGRNGATVLYSERRRNRQLFSWYEKRKQSPRDCFRKIEYSASQLDDFEDELEEGFDEESLFVFFLFLESLEEPVFSESFFAACL